MNLTLLRNMLIPTCKSLTQSVQFFVWRDEVHFSVPKANIILPEEERNYFFISPRKFINTQSLQSFEHWDDLFDIFIAYRSGWQFNDGIFKLQPGCALNLTVYIFHQAGAAAEKYGTLIEQKNLENWLSALYRRRHAVFGQIGLTPSTSEFSRIDFRALSETTYEANQLDISFSQHQLNHLCATKAQIYMNAQDYYLVLDEHNVLCFAFEATPKLDKNITTTMEQVNSTINNILSSLSVTFDRKHLGS